MYSSQKENKEEKRTMMTVNELINYLQKQDQDAVILVSNGHCCDTRDNLQVLKDENSLQFL